MMMPKFFSPLKEPLTSPVTLFLLLLPTTCCLGIGSMYIKNQMIILLLLLLSLLISVLLYCFIKNKNFVMYYMLITILYIRENIPLIKSLIASLLPTIFVIIASYIITK